MLELYRKIESISSFKKLLFGFITAEETPDGKWGVCFEDKYSGVIYQCWRMDKCEMTDVLKSLENSDAGYEIVPIVKRRNFHQYCVVI